MFHILFDYINFIFPVLLTHVLDSNRRKKGYQLTSWCIHCMRKFILLQIYETIQIEHCALNVGFGVCYFTHEMSDYDIIVQGQNRLSVTNDLHFK